MNLPFCFQEKPPKKRCIPFQTATIPFFYFHLPPNWRIRLNALPGARFFKFHLALILHMQSMLRISLPGTFAPFIRLQMNFPIGFQGFFKGGKSRLSKEVLIHPGSGSPRKNWPLENFIQLCRFLQDRGFQPKWVIGPAENFMKPALEKNGIADIHIYLNEDLVETTIRINRAAGVYRE